MKLGQNAWLSNCSDEFDGSGERSRAILALLFVIFMLPQHLQWHIAIHLYVCVCMRACVLYRLYSELKKSSCEKPVVQFQPNVAGLFLVKGFQSCSKNLIPCRNLVAIATERNDKNEFKKIFL
jgi:hypothetical protein